MKGWTLSYRITKLRIKINILVMLVILFVTGCCHLGVGCSDTTHIVQPGDTLEHIAIRYYGSELHMRLILEANFLKEEGIRLKKGQRIKIPRR